MNREEWKKKYDEDMSNIHKEYPHWSMEKCKFMVLKGMPRMDSDGWE